MATETKVHSWVKHIVVPVQVVPTFEAGEDGIYAIVDPVLLEIAQDKGVHGCENCGALLTFETSITDCPGKEQDD